MREPCVVCGGKPVYACSLCGAPGSAESLAKLRAENEALKARLEERFEASSIDVQEILYCRKLIPELKARAEAAEARMEELEVRNGSLISERNDARHLLKEFHEKCPHGDAPHVYALIVSKTKLAEERDTFRDLARELAEALDAEKPSMWQSEESDAYWKRRYAALQRAREAGLLGP